MGDKTTAQLINQDSGKAQYYTPGYILQAAREVMGPSYGPNGESYSFDLDPASDPYGNQHVNAFRFFDEKMNGLNHSWEARSIWLNHPYSRAFNQAWTTKAVNEYLSGRAKQICMITWASTSERWAHPLLKYPICFLDKRVKFIDPNRVLTGATKSSMVTYMGPNIDDFVEVFGEIGNVMIPARMYDGEGSSFALYQTDAGRTSNGKIDDERRIMCATVGLCEEAGEVLGLHKKWNYHGHTMDTNKLAEELGDTLWYLAETCSSWGLSLKNVAKGNIAKLRRRYPDGFDRERSKNRDALERD